MVRVASLTIDSAGWTGLLLAYSAHRLWRKVRLTTNHVLLPGRSYELVDDSRYQGERKPVVSEVECLVREIACSSMDIGGAHLTTGCILAG